MEQSDRHRLELAPEEMRRLGYRVVDLLVEHYECLPQKPATRRGERRDLEKLLREPMPARGSDALDVLSRVEEQVFGHIMHVDHPRFFGFVPSPSNFVAAMADALASGFNVFAGTWLEGSGPAQVELVTIDWLREACGLPEGAGGLFVSGGSMANITALGLARHRLLPTQEQRRSAVIYCSDQTHSSIDRGLGVLGFEPEQLQRLPNDGDYRLQIAGLRAAIAADRREGKLPWLIVANAGTTNTGAVDPLRALAKICQEEGLWLHIDGAYGAAAVLTRRGREVLDGLDRADSVVLDPHKWLFQPYEIGCLLVREEGWLQDAFHVLPEYLEDTEGRGEGGLREVNFCDRGIQLTRSFRALKLWMSLQVFGRQGFEAALDLGMDLAQAAEAEVRALPNWQVVTPALLAVLTFRYEPPGRSVEEADLVNRWLVEALIADGSAMVSSTVLEGRTVLRMCTINPRTTVEDVQSTLNSLNRLAKAAGARSAGVWQRG